MYGALLGDDPLTNDQDLLLEYWNKLGPHGQEVMLALAARLAKGAAKYGDFPKRKWTKESAEEALDLCVYLSAELIFDPPPDGT